MSAVLLFCNTCHHCSSIPVCLSVSPQLVVDKLYMTMACRQDCCGAHWCISCMARTWPICWWLTVVCMRWAISVVCICFCPEVCNIDCMSANLLQTCKSASYSTGIALCSLAGHEQQLFQQNMLLPWRLWQQGRGKQYPGISCTTSWCNVR